MEIGPVGSSRSWIVGGPRGSLAMAKDTLSNNESTWMKWAFPCESFNSVDPVSSVHLSHAEEMFILYNLLACAHVGCGRSFDGTSYVVIDSKCTC